MTELKLDRNDLESSLWKRLQAHYEERLRVLRAQNDGDMDDKQTARMRGRIAEIKGFLVLGSQDESAGTE